MGEIGDQLIALGIEASNPSAGGASIALASLTRDADAWRAQHLDAELLDVSDRRRDDLMPAIDRLCQRQGVAPGRLGLVAVSAGPGGFTAVRTAVAVAAGLALATGAKVAGVPTELALARRAVRDGAPAGAFAIALASKRGEAWVRAFDSAAQPIDAGRPIDEAGFAALVERAGIDRLIVDRFCPEAWRERASALGVEVVPPVFDAAAVIEAGTAVAWTDAEGLAPIYPREPEAVRVWRERHGG